MTPKHPTRILPLLALAAAWVSPASHAQDGEASATALPAPDARTFIPDSLEVPVFVPPAPPVEKQVPAMRVDDTVSVPTAAGHTLTVLRGEASTLPDIPAPVVMEQRPPRELTAEELARRTEARRLRLHFSAQVHPNGVSVIRWQHPDTEEPYEAICGFDVNLLAGLGRFSSDGKIYQLDFIPPGVVPTDRRPFPKLPAPTPPEAAPDTVTPTPGHADDPIGTATARLLPDLTASEKSRLPDYQEKRAAWQQAAIAWEKAHPIHPRDGTLWLRPHRGSRYLPSPAPEQGGDR